MNNRLSVAMQAVEKATGLAMAYFNDRHTLDITTKSAQDLVSRADFEVEQLLRAELSKHFPDDTILGEEMGGEFITDGWVIDPIDGTGNYLRGTPLWGIAVAYMSAGEPEIGVVAYPALGYTLAARTGDGLLRNGVPFVRPQPPEHLRIAGVGENTRWDAEEMGKLHLSLRRQGWGLAGYRCATIGLAFAALGQTDGYMEKFTSLWDIAAGAVICREAGLLCTIEGEQKQGSMTVMVGREELMEIFGA
ncbi:inositol monophosphatase [Pseudomonas amygdali pv. tabaci str. ATCC 11528]|uniref:Inositol monophosphatase protein n=11 Tax=Pseudomonas syringae group TaxID=136849 RepID=A0A0Q0AKR1_PSEAJ|nr:MULTISPECIES: inositol monophosphatase family protein [Pseudomonas]KPX97944.1 Inositol monophosphatase family protein [Pseudomonas amygdali pv. mori]PPS26225.1 inositol monophosphatase [Pseudomonas amygdali pv. morsprunorum]ARA83117.1 inositol monophosphatase [Pseudomonas amygdali pv. lachrymans]AXH54374.1 inositol monophosphatase [Pseudomonas amygdali pv. lachrymans str. M301315]ELQ13666.1 inositol monophosphatase [Pseudomonas syringae BRIP39023]